MVMVSYTLSGSFSSIALSLEEHRQFGTEDANEVGPNQDKLRPRS
jgi:hypothetical protein